MGIDSNHIQTVAEQDRKINNYSLKTPVVCGSVHGIKPGASDSWKDFVFHLGSINVFLILFYDKYSIAIASLG